MAERVVPPANYERRDVRFGPMAVAALLMALALIFLALIASWLFPSAVRDPRFRMEGARFPAPVLQPSPAADMARFYQAEMQWLNGTGWVDRARGIAHIPIADAMRDVAQRGIPDWGAGDLHAGDVQGGQGELARKDGAP